VTIDGKRLATETHLQPQVWLDAVDRRGSGESLRAEVTPREQAEEYLMMSLRLAEGTEVSRFNALGAEPLPAQKLRELEELGLVEQEGGRLRATAAGRPVLNGVLRSLLT
jgi:oxygen-independent coproporphyrinogen-3 oxidase